MDFSAYTFRQYLVWLNHGSAWRNHRICFLIAYDSCQYSLYKMILREWNLFWYKFKQFAYVYYWILCHWLLLVYRGLRQVYLSRSLIRCSRSSLKSMVFSSLNLSFHASIIAFKCWFMVKMNLGRIGGILSHSLFRILKFLVL